MGLVLGYNTNGLTDHRLDDALGVIAACGYRAVGLTLHPAHLDPARVGPGDLARLRARLDGLGLARRIVETGARYLLDPWNRHEPGLADPDLRRRALRQDLLKRAVDVAHALGAEAVAFASGNARPEDGAAFDRVAAGAAEIAGLCRQAGVHPAFEPEPGMCIDTLAAFERLNEAAGGCLRLTLDVGHVACEGKDLAEAIERFAPLVANVHVEDIRGREHRHLPFGEGEIAWRPVFLSLSRHVGERAPVVVELGRDAYRGPDLARSAILFLRKEGA